MIPLEIGLMDEKGKELISKTLILKQKEEEFIFKNIKERPVLSINRNFTAPITIKMSYSEKDTLILMKKDTDLFNRYEVGQEYALQEILKSLEGKEVSKLSHLVEAFSSYLDVATKDPAFTARAIIFPASTYIGEKMKVFDVDKVLELRKNLRLAFALKNEKRLKEIYDTLNTKEAFSTDAKQAGKRALKNTALSYLSLLPNYENLAERQYNEATNMTDKMAALSALVHNKLPYAPKALQNFYKTFKDDALVINKWLALQASVEDEDTIQNVNKLSQTKDFVITNPNKVRSLIGVFGRNLKAFHDISGSGYQLLADFVIQLNSINPQIAEGIVHPLCDWKRFDKKRQELMKKELKRIQQTENLSVNLAETITKALID